MSGICASGSHKVYLRRNYLLAINLDITANSRVGGYAGNVGEPATMRGRRDETAIMHDVLSLVIRNDATRTKIKTRCNLNFESTVRIINKLMQQELIVQDSLEGRVTYKATDKGHRVFSQLVALSHLTRETTY